MENIPFALESPAILNCIKSRITTELLHARRRVDLTQAQVAERMGTKPPAVARLESNHTNSRHSPSIATLRKYAHAVNCKLEIHLVPKD
ncbi:MAG: helix-turn-helix transcriptional regulator [Magnetococcales bacterium]|nr:helix-turn-helix transcriptional regulator [Magnetococcales bacterium]